MTIGIGSICVRFRRSREYYVKDDKQCLPTATYDYRSFYDSEIAEECINKLLKTLYKFKKLDEKKKSSKVKVKA